MSGVILRTWLTSYTGYGGIAKWLGVGLDRHGAFLGYSDMGTDTRFLPVDPWVAAHKPSTAVDGLVLQLSTPDRTLPVNRKTVLFTMWESSRLDALAVANCNQAEAVIVPCRYNRDGFRASGVTVPTYVVPLGVSADEGFVPQPYRDDGPYTFGMAARMQHGGVRKGLNEGMRAFVKAFDRKQDVRLELKVYPDCLPYLRAPDDPRIKVVTTPMLPHEMAGWYGGVDCLFVPSKGEGWGLHTLQAMACSRPVIAAPHSGTTEFWDSRFGWALDYVLEPAGEFYAGQGDWAVPTEESMVDCLRSAFRFRATGRHRGEAAARRAGEFTWERTGDALIGVLKIVESGIRDARPLADMLSAR